MGALMPREGGVRGKLHVCALAKAHLCDSEASCQVSTYQRVVPAPVTKFLSVACLLANAISCWLQGMFVSVVLKACGWYAPACSTCIACGVTPCTAISACFTHWANSATELGCATVCVG